MSKSRHHVNGVYDPALDLPPPFRPVRLRERSVTLLSMRAPTLPNWVLER